MCFCISPGFMVHFPIIYSVLLALEGDLFIKTTLFLWSESLIVLLNRKHTKKYLFYFSKPFLVETVHWDPLPIQSLFVRVFLFSFFLNRFIKLFTVLISLFFSPGFVVLFSILDPVPYEVKLIFHVFGGVSFLVGLILTIFTSLAVECVSINPYHNFVL